RWRLCDTPSPPPSPTRRSSDLVVVPRDRIEGLAALGLVRGPRDERLVVALEIRLERLGAIDGHDEGSRARSDRLVVRGIQRDEIDRKSTRLNSSPSPISHPIFC